MRFVSHFISRDGKGRSTCNAGRIRLNKANFADKVTLLVKARRMNTTQKICILRLEEHRFMQFGTKIFCSRPHCTANPLFWHPSTSHVTCSSTRAPTATFGILSQNRGFYQMRFRRFCIFNPSTIWKGEDIDFVTNWPVLWRSPRKSARPNSQWGRHVEWACGSSEAFLFLFMKSNLTTTALLEIDFPYTSAWNPFFGEARSVIRSTQMFL